VALVCFFGLKLQRPDCHSFASQTKAATLSSFICKLSSCIQIKKRVEEIGHRMLKLNKTSFFVLSVSAFVMSATIVRAQNDAG